MNVRSLKQRLRTKYATCFPEPNDTRLIQILGATTLTIGAFKNDKGHPLTFILSRGHILRSENFRRKLVDDKGLFINGVKSALAIQSDGYRRDIVKEFEMDEWFQHNGYRVRWIPRSWLYENPDRVRSFVKQFIYA